MNADDRPLPMLPLAQPQPWMVDGSCHGHEDPDLWHPASIDPAEAREAIAICSTCPVQKACFEYAEAAGESGVWGGAMFTTRALRGHPQQQTMPDFVNEYRFTWTRHHGHISAAALVFRLKPQALVRRLHRAKAAGHEVEFTDDTRELTEEQRVHKNRQRMEAYYRKRRGSAA